jgi:hypothetical protein
MTRGPETPEERARTIEVKRRLYGKEAPTYDREADFTERLLFGIGHRGWACSKAMGDTLEVAIGTGLNLPHYPRRPSVHVMAGDFRMHARDRLRAGIIERLVAVKTSL